MNCPHANIAKAESNRENLFSGIAEASPILFKYSEMNGIVQMIGKDARTGSPVKIAKAERQAKLVRTCPRRSLSSTNIVKAERQGENLFSDLSEA